MPGRSGPTKKAKKAKHAAAMRDLRLRAQVAKSKPDPDLALKFKRYRQAKEAKLGGGKDPVARAKDAERLRKHRAAKHQEQQGNILKHRSTGHDLHDDVRAFEELYDLRPVDAPFTPPDCSFEGHVKAAAQFREKMWEGAPHPNCICAVCVRMSSPTTTQHMNLTFLPNLELLRADIDGTPQLPRHAKTTRKLGGVEYCLAPAPLTRTSGLPALHTPPHGADPEEWGYACEECLSHLGQNRIPRASLVRVDPGARPVHLEPLTMLESNLLALGRTPARHIMTVSKSKGKRPNGLPEEMSNRGHVIALPNQTAENLATTFPCDPALLPDLVQVVMLYKADDDADVSLQ
jgi:hypothetical protein